MRPIKYASAVLLAIGFGGADAATAQIYTTSARVDGIAKVGLCKDINGNNCSILGGPKATCLNLPSGWNDAITGIDMIAHHGCRFFQYVVRFHRIP
ncbi:hypothetical protein VTJ49DRAFT_7655 [Mycothermus thermophilus]|uniref:Uncharacterized protein n=1 Tax=Humicola insolens TaxID=85995 RepID=A0ABR3VG69_HUMIN